MRTLYIAPS